MSVRHPAVLLCCACFVACAAADLPELPELPAGRTLAVGRDAIFVRQSGTGPDVVLLHGLGDSSLGWRYLEQPLVDAGYRVTVWDALGAGRSDKPAGGDYTIEAHRRRLEAVFDQLGIARAALVGHSLGGSIALRFAQCNPDRVRAMFLIDPAAYREGALEGRWFWDVPLLAEIVLGVISTETLVDFGLSQNYHDAAAIPDELRRLYLREARRDGVIAALIEQERQLIPADPEAWEQGHRRIAVPTFVLWGASDALVPVAQGWRLSREVAGAGLIVLADLAHSPQLEDPPAVLSYLLPFVAVHAP